MTFEEKVMAERARQDFVTVRPRGGDVCIVAGDYVLKLAAGETKEITRAEWNELYAHRGCLEEVTDAKGLEAGKG